MERIAIIMGKMHSGGKKNLVMEYYRHIDKSKIQFDFICDDDSNAIPFEEIELLGGKVFVVSRYQNIVKNIIETRKIIKNGNYRIVHAYNGTMNLFGLFAAWLGGAKIRINESISMAHSSDRKTVLKKILKPFSRCFSTHYMANGEVCGRWQFGNKLFDAGKVNVFKTVIDTEKHDYNIALREKCRAEYGMENSIVFGHIGRLTEQKNTLFIIDIFHEICKREENVKLLLIGDGNLRDDMLKRIDYHGLNDKVIYLGRREDIHQFYNAMDCFLLPSLYEGLPVVGVEAECCGLPMLFSTEIPRESSACDDIGLFCSLEKGAVDWAEEALKIAKKNIGCRTDRRNAVKLAGFDSSEEGKKLTDYYLSIY